MDSCILWLPGEFSQRGTPAREGRKEWLLPLKLLHTSYDFPDKIIPCFQAVCSQDSFFFLVLVIHFLLGSLEARGEPHLLLLAQNSHTITCGSLIPICSFLVSLFINTLSLNCPNLTVPFVPCGGMSGTLFIPEDSYKNESWARCAQQMESQLPHALEGPP